MPMPCNAPSCLDLPTTEPNALLPTIKWSDPEDPVHTEQVSNDQAVMIPAAETEFTDGQEPLWQAGA